MPDSGADACVFPLSLAILLKLDVLNLPKAYTGGVGSQNNPTYYDTVTIDMGEGIVFKGPRRFCGRHGHDWFRSSGPGRVLLTAQRGI